MRARASDCVCVLMRLSEQACCACVHIARAHLDTHTHTFILLVRTSLVFTAHGPLGTSAGEAAPGPQCSPP